MQIFARIIKVESLNDTLHRKKRRQKGKRHVKLCILYPKGRRYFHWFYFRILMPTLTACSDQQSLCRFSFCLEILKFNYLNLNLFNYSDEI